MGKSQALEWFKELIPQSSAEQTWTRLLLEESRNQEPTFATPVRQVHAQIKPPHLLGSFSAKGFRAGELSMAHGGLLIADEFMEWPRDAKECLREPLQNKKVIVTRVQGQHQLPCDIQLVGTGNLCPCGGVPPTFRSLITLEPKQFPCRCKMIDFHDYFKKLSGPIADRIDLVHLHIALPKYESRVIDAEAWRARIEANQTFAKKTFGKLPSELEVDWLEKNLPDHKSFNSMLNRLPSLRARHKVLRVARTLQSMDRNPALKEEHVFEAISMRIMDNLE